MQSGEVDAHFARALFDRPLQKPGFGGHGGRHGQPPKQWLLLKPRSVFSDGVSLVGPCCSRTWRSTDQPSIPLTELT